MNLGDEYISSLTSHFKDGKKLNTGEIASILRGENEEIYAKVSLVKKIYNYMDENIKLDDSPYADLGKKAVHSRERRDKSGSNGTEEL